MNADGSRRRPLLIGGIGALVFLALIALAILVAHDDEPSRVVPADSTMVSGADATAEPSPGENAVTSSSTATASSSAMTPAATAPATIPVAPAPATTATTTTAPATTATTAPPPALVPALPTSVVAIAEDGDLSLIRAGDETIIRRVEGSDPRTPPDEGEASYLDSAVVIGERMLYSTCCEPVPGTIYDADVGWERALVFGHGMVLSPDRKRIAAVGGGSVTIFDPSGRILASADAESSVYRQPESVVWLDDQRLAVIELRGSGSGMEMQLVSIDASLGGYANAEGVSLGIETGMIWPRLAGVGADGSILVFRRNAEAVTTRLLEAYDPVTLQRLPAGDLPLPGDAVDAWYEHGLLTWVAVDGSIHLGEQVIPAGPAPFTWARPMYP